MKISIVGCGPGGAGYLLPVAREAVEQASVVLGSPRLLALFDLGNRQGIELPARSGPAIETIENSLPLGPVAVLVSGDPGTFSLAQSVVHHFGRETCRVIPGVSSAQVALAALGVTDSSTRVISLHGRTMHVPLNELKDEDAVAILAGTHDAMRDAADVADALADTHQVFACENVTLPNEQIYRITPEQMRTKETVSLTVLILLRSE